MLKQERRAAVRAGAMRALCAAAVVAASVTLTFCDNVTGPAFPSDAEQFNAPPVFATWWNMTQSCSGLTGSLGAVTWYKTTETLRDPRTEEVLDGYWTADGNRIVLLASAMLEGGLVRHEMLHALIRAGGHPRNQFLGKCAGIVLCVQACVRDAGPYPEPPESPQALQADAFDITVNVEPTNPTAGVDGGFFSITVTARNPTNHWATAAPQSPSFGMEGTFSFEVMGQNGGMIRNEIAYDPSERVFAPGETKRRVFDLRIGDAPFSNQLPPGDYTVRAAFSDHWMSPTPFVVGP